MKDTLGFVIGYRTYQDTVEPTINGRSLTEIVGEVESAFATAEGDPGRAGEYAGLPQHLALAPSRFLLGEQPYQDQDAPSGLIRLLWCPCGYDCTNGIFAKIEVAGEEVTWSDFSHHAGTPSYESLGPFRFDRQQYTEALQVEPTVKSPVAERLDREAEQRRRQWDEKQAGTRARWQGLAERIQDLPRLLPQVLDEAPGRNRTRFRNYIAEHQCSPDGRALFGALQVLLRIGEHNECSEEFWREMISVGEQFQAQPPTPWP